MLAPSDFMPKFEKKWQDPAVRDAKLMAIAQLYHNKAKQ